MLKDITNEYYIIGYPDSLVSRPAGENMTRMYIYWNMTTNY